FAYYVSSRDAYPLTLHSFPTRRPSDLVVAGAACDDDGPADRGVQALARHHAVVQAGVALHSEGGGVAIHPCPRTLGEVGQPEVLRQRLAAPAEHGLQ